MVAKPYSAGELKHGPITLEGNIVISVGLIGHADGEYQTVLTEGVKDTTHYFKEEKSINIRNTNSNGNPSR